MEDKIIISYSLDNVDINVGTIPETVNISISESAGPKGDKGDTGNTGAGVPTGGTTGQVLAKIDGTNYNTQWVTNTGGGGTTDHSTLSHLDYAASGHTGFQPAGTYSTDIHSNITALNTVSGVNTGDETTSTIKTKLGITTLSGSNTGDQDLSGYQLTSQKNQANGYSGLDSGGKIPIDNLPTTLLQYEETWDPTTNTPTLTANDLSKVGFVYTVTGTTSPGYSRFGITWNLGDWAIYNATGNIQKSDNSDDVTSVNGLTGAIVLTTANIADSTGKRYVSDSEKSAITHANRSTLDLLSWNSQDSTIEFPLDANSTLQIGQEEVLRIYNNTGSIITNGQVVYINGSSGTRPTVALATNATEAGSENTIGVATQDIAINSEGFVTTSGLVRGLDTNAFLAGDILYLGTGGALTKTKPTAPNHAIKIGYCVKKAGAADGIILVKVDSGFELSELHDVDATATKTTPIDADSVLLYDSVVSIWKRLTWSNIKSTLKTYFDTLYLTSVTRDNSLNGGGTSASPLGMASMFDRARLVGLQYVEDFAITDSLAFTNTKGFNPASAASGTYSLTNSEFIVSSSASANSGYSLYFNGTSPSGTSLAKPLGFYKDISGILYVTTSKTNKVLRIGHGTALSSTPTDGCYIEFSGNDIFAKTAKTGVGITTIATLVTNYSVDTYYRCIVDISNPLSVNFYVYNSSNTLLASANATSNLPTSSMSAACCIINSVGSAATVVGKLRLLGVTIAPINL